VKSLPLKDGDASGNLKKPPDDATQLASLSSCHESGVTMPKKTQRRRNDDDVSNVQRTSDVEPKSSNKKTMGLEEAQEEQSDTDIDASEMSDAFRPSMSKYHSTSRSQKYPEVTIRTDHSDIDKLVMAIGSLTTTINECRKSELKFCEDERQHHESEHKYHEDECRYHESEQKVISELCEFTKMQASEAHQHEQMILNGVEAMGNNIAKAINSEIQAMSTRMDVLNQASLDAIMNKLNTSSYMKETSRPRTADYTTPSKSPSTPNPKPEPSRPKDEKESKHSPPIPMPPGRNGPKCPLFPNPGPTSRGHPHQPDPGGGDDNDGGGGGGGRQPPAREDPGMIQTQMTIQVWTITRKWIEKGIALPLVIPLHQQDTTGASLTCLAGTQIPHAYECLVNVSQKCAITHLENESTKLFRMPLMTYLDVHLSPQEHMHISKLL
jgi:hypothetical protein